MGFFDTFKKSRKQVNRENQEQGKIGERRIKEEYEFSGYKVKRTGKGHDLKAEKKDWLTGKKETKYIEVKTGNSKLSKLQKKKRGYLGKKYVVERLEPTLLGLVSNNRESDKSKKRKKKDRSSSLGFGNVSFWSDDFEAKKKTKKKSITKKKSTKKKSDSIWGSNSSMDSIFGSTKTKKKTNQRKITKKKSHRKKKTTDIWGSTNTRRKNIVIW
ncbi:hypothetical protein [Candidatus Nitrosopumilus sediminis]|uniref:Uncharacterized protein n=1 Tax=Candidatus Nitrosopumilus sediminis TaxID=1229909 RepID=K0BD85_9ARCH|nr:hypothetical protein [Candidatus Nitrosopumilus sediminis]AFS82995.1 hypothetical protein NSED_05965 [Candidatus Nitrosopumilus sediminis]